MVYDTDEDDDEEVTYSPPDPLDPVSTAAPVVVRSLLAGFLSLVSSSRDTWS